MGGPPIRIAILHSVSGAEFEGCYIEKEKTIRIEELVQNRAPGGHAKDLADLESLAD